MLKRSDLLVVPRWKAMEFRLEELISHYGDHSLKGAVAEHVTNTFPRMTSTDEPWQRIIHITITDHRVDIDKVRKEIEDINEYSSFLGKLWFVVDVNFTQIFP